MVKKAKKSKGGGGISAEMTTARAAAVLALAAATHPDEVQRLLTALDVPCDVRDALIVQSVFLAAAGIKPCDTAAAMRWLVNRDPAHWSARSRGLPKAAEETPAPPANPLAALKVIA